MSVSLVINLKMKLVNHWHCYLSNFSLITILFCYQLQALLFTD